MAKLNAVEKDIENAKALLAEVLGKGDMEAVSVLMESADMGMKSFRVLTAIRPLIVSVWSGMSNSGDPRRFTLENILKDMDSVIGHWVVPDEIEKEETDSPEK